MWIDVKVRNALGSGGRSQSALTHSFHSWLLPPETSPGLGDEETKMIPLKLWQGEGKSKAV